MKYTIDTALVAVKGELTRSNEKFPLFHSKHEGFAVLKEEVDELWDDIKKKEWRDSLTQQEAIQVAAMAIKMLISDIWK